jgi:sodium/proline symporter
MKLLVIALYFIIIIGIGIIASRKVKNSKEFVLGGRKFNALTTALGAGASDMSGWLMMAFPGAVYLHGTDQLWFPTGLFIGAYLNWKFIAARLRVDTQKRGDALTIASYLSNKFNDTSGNIRVLTGAITSIFFVVYIASALVALAFVISTFTSFNYIESLISGAAFILLYSSIGGFVAINWVDVMQGSLMMFALIIVPIVILIDQTNTGNLYDQIQTLDMNIDGFLNTDGVLIISLLAWGLGYFGQPHILVRFMAIKEAKSLKASMRICLTWMVIVLLGAFCVGLFGRFLFPITSKINPETIFLLSANKILPAWLSGVILAAVLSAIMSTISAQIHATACAVTEDLIPKNCVLANFMPSKVWLTRIMMLLVVLIATMFAANPKNTILSLVKFAWSGLGSAFGPVILFSLYSNKMTRQGVLYGIMTGALTVLLWYAVSDLIGIVGLNEIVPGFIMASIVIMISNWYYKNK